jgi:hypothetical protein
LRNTAEIALRLVPQGEQRPQPGGGELDAAGQKRVAHRCAAAEPHPGHGEVLDSGGLRLFLDQLLVAGDD